MQVLNKSQSSQLKGLEALHNAEASEVMKRLEQESKVEATLFSLSIFLPRTTTLTNKKSHTSTQFSSIRQYNCNGDDCKVEEQEQGSVVSLSKEEQQRDRRTKMVKRGVFERGKLQVFNITLLNSDMTVDSNLTP